MSQQSVEKSFIVLLGLLIGLSPLAVDMYLPAMPAIGTDLGATPEAVQQTLSLYLACFALPQLLFGPLSDGFGRRLTMLLGLFLFAAGSLACSLAGDIDGLILARGLQGIGASALVVTVPALVRDRVAGSEFARVMGFIMLVMALAPLLAPITGGLILTLAGWRAIFGTLAVLALVGLLFFHLRIGETLPRERRTLPHPRRLASNYAALLSQRQSLCFMLCGGMVFAGMMAFLAGSPFVYIQLYGISEQHYGLLFALNIIAMMSITTLANRFVTRLGALRILKYSMGLVLLASLVLLLLSQWRQPAIVPLVMGIVVFVGCNGVVSANTMALVMEHFGHISGSASAMAGAIRFGLGALASMVLAMLHDGTARPLMLVMVGCGLLTLLFYALGAWKAEQVANSAKTGP